MLFLNSFKNLKDQFRMLIQEKSFSLKCNSENVPFSLKIGRDLKIVMALFSIHFGT